MGDFKQSRTKVPSLTVTGDLTVEGDTTTISTTNTVVKDKLIELSNGTSGTPSGDAGIVIERGDSTNAIFAWDESVDGFIVGTGNITGASTGNLTITAAPFTASSVTVTTNLDVDGVANLDNTDIDGTFTMDGTTFDVNATAAVTIDGTTVSIDGTDDVNVTVTSSTGGEDLTIQQIGANDSSIIITAAGTGTDAIKIDATAGDMQIAPSLADAKTLKIGKNGAVEMVFSPHGTAASEKFLLTNTAGTTDDAIKLHSAAGGITLLAANDSLVIDADGTDADALNVTSAGGVDIIAAGAADKDIDITNTAGSVNITAGESAGDSIKITSTAGGIDILASGAGEDIDITATGSSVNITSSENDAGAVYIAQTTGTSGAIKIHADTGTAATSILVDSDVGGVKVNAGLDGNAAAIHLDSASGVTIAGGDNNDSVFIENSPLSLEQISAPDTTTNKLYNVGGTLTWSGGALTAGTGASTSNANVFTATQTISFDTNGEGVNLILANTDDDTDADGAVSIRFDLEDSAGGAVDSGKIKVSQEANMTGTGTTQDTKMHLQTSLNGTLADKVTIDSAGIVSLVLDDSELRFGDGNDVVFAHDNGTGMDITSAGDFDISSGGNVTVTSTVDEANAIYLRANAGTSETVKIHADQGTGEASIELTSDAGGIDLNAAAGKDITMDAGQILVTSAHNVANAIYLRANAGTTETIKIHADQGNTEGSIELTSDAGGIDLNANAAKDITMNAGQILVTSAHNTANAIYLRANAGTSETIKIHADQGTSVTEGAASIQLLTDAGGIGIKSTANLADAVLITADGGTSETINIHSDQGTGEGESASIVIQSDDGGISLVTNSAKDLSLTGGQAIITAEHNVANAIYLRANAGTSETIKIHADQGTGAGSIELTSDAGSVDVNAGDNVTIDAADLITLTTADTGAAGKISLVSGVAGANVAIHLDGNANASSEVQIDAGILDIDVTGAATLDATSMTTTAATQSIVASTSLTVTSPSTIITSTTSTKPTLELRNTTDNDGAAGPQLTFSKFPGDDQGQADDVALGSLLFKGFDGADNTTTFGQMTVHSADKSSGDEGGEFRFSVMNGGIAGAASLTEIFTIGGEDKFGNTPCEVTINESSVDCDFRVESGDKTHMLFVDAANNRVSIGDSTNDPAAILEIEGASDSAVPVLKVITADVDQVGVEFLLANTTAIGVDVVGSNTTTEVMKITANDLSTGSALNVISNASSAGDIRSIVKITNDHVDAALAVPLDIKNDADSTDAAGITMLKMTAGAGADVLTLRAKTATIATPSGALIKDVSNFFPAGCIPVGFAIKVTTVIPASKFVTKIGTDAVTDYAFGNASNAGSGGGGLGTTDDLQAENDVKLSAPSAQSERFFEAATTLRVTFDGDPGNTSGVIRFTMYYYQMDAG